MTLPATVAKSQLELRHYPLDMDALVASGAVLSTVQTFISRASPPDGVYPLQATTLAALVTVGDATIHLSADVKAGALLIIEPGTGAEERLKVISTAAHSGHFDAVVIPTAWTGHSNGAAVSYEPGVSGRMLVDDTPTPSGVSVMLAVQKGAHGQTYRGSYFGVANNGEEVEDEVLIVITDPTPLVTNIKQPTESRDLAAEFDDLLAESHQGGAILSSAVAYASDQVTVTTTLAAQGTAEDGTLSLTAHPGVGAMLILTPAGAGSNPPERVYVSAVSGTGPFTATIAPTLEFTHSNGADVTVYPGISTNFLVSTTSSIQGLTAINRARRGAHGKTFKMVWVALTSQGEVLAHQGFCSLQEL